MPKKAIRSYIIENAIAPNPLTPAELSEKHGIKVESIHRITARLRDAGVIPDRLENRPSRTLDRPIPIPVAQAQDGKHLGKIRSTKGGRPYTLADVEEIATVEVMPELERLQRLTQMARYGSDMVQIAAITKLEELGRSRGTSVGPGKPLTPDEQIARLARLCMALGRELSERALKIAFPEAPDELSSETSPLDSGPSPSSSDVGGLNTRIEP